MVIQLAMDIMVLLLLLAADGCYADMGGAYVGKTQSKLLQVIKELGLETYSKVSFLDSVYTTSVRKRSIELATTVS